MSARKTALIACLLLLSAPQARAGDAARGAYVEKLGDCIACHSAPGHEPFSGGLPMQSPIGIIYSTNITPDPDYGIGRYTLGDFTRAVRDGIARDGHHLYPAMPYPEFSLASDRDIADLYAFFMKDVKPVHYLPPKTSLLFPMNQRWGMALWNLVFTPHKIFTPDITQDDQWNRGAYIARGLAHCGACHTPRTLFYNEESFSEASPSFLGGNTIDDWQAADLRRDPASSLGGWSEKEITAFLKTGRGHNTISFGGMNQAIEDSTQHLSDADLKSLAHYLKSIAGPGEKPAPAAPAPTETYPIEHPGAGLYLSLCAGCHEPSGAGQSPSIPALANNPAVLLKSPISLIHITLEGGATPRTADSPKPAAMPAFARLTDREIAEILSYIRTSWGNHATPVSEGFVAAFRKTLAHDNESKREAAEKAR